MRSIKYLSLLLVLMIIGNELSAQIIIVDSRNLVDTTRGFSGNVSTNSNFNANTALILSGGLSTELSYHWKKNRILSLNNYSVILNVEQSRDAAVNQGYQHFRFMRDFNQTYTITAFSQIQTNPVLRIRKRILVGAGPRFNFQPYGTNKLFMGTMLMYEYEDEADTSAYHRDLRASIFLQYKLNLDEDVKIGLITYYQPRLGELRDFRLSSSLDLKIKIRKNLSWTVVTNLLYDAFPVVDNNIPKLTYNFTNGLSLNF